VATIDDWLPSTSAVVPWFRTEWFVEPGLRDIETDTPTIVAFVGGKDPKDRLREDLVDVVKRIASDSCYRHVDDGDDKKTKKKSPVAFVLVYDSSFPKIMQNILRRTAENYPR
jgi:hypothetical protein